MVLVETVDDFATVHSAEGPHGCLSLVDTASEWFDVAHRAEGTFAKFAAVESADGGPPWFIPWEIAELVPNDGANIDSKNAVMS